MIHRLIVVLFMSLAMAARPTQTVSPKSTASYAISGTVVDSITGQPIAGVKVLADAVEHNEFWRSSLTAPDGKFSFANLPAGKYSVTASARGYRLQGFNQHGDFFSAIVIGPDLSGEGLRFRLFPDAAIEGTVTDDDGEPVRNASVMLFQRNNDSGRQRTQQISNASTDDRGHYQFSHLTAGAYFVAVSARPWFAQYPSASEPPPAAEDATRVAEEKAQLDIAYPLTFYPSAAQWAEASALRVHPGDRVMADISVRGLPAVHLRITIGSTDSGTAGAGAAYGFPRVSQRIFEGTLVPVMSAQSASYAGAVEYTGIAPGHYIVEVPDPGGKSHGGGWYKELDLSGDVEFDARENPSLASVTGALLLEGGTRPAGKIYVVLVNRNSGESYPAEVSSKGTFDFGDSQIRPGTYDVVLNNATGFQVKSLLTRGARVAGQTLEISSGSAQLVVTATHSVARIDGLVLRDDKPFAGAMVVLVPRNPASNLTLFRRDQSDSDGTFTFHEVLPGSYTAIALENAWDLDWASPAALQPYLKNGTPLDVAGEGTLSLKVQSQ